MPRVLALAALFALAASAPAGTSAAAAGRSVPARDSAAARVSAAARESAAARDSAARDSAAARVSAAQLARDFPPPDAGPLVARAGSITGPRGIFAVPDHGRPLTIWGAGDASARLLVAGCVNAHRCAGSDVVNADMVDCPPPDAEMWLFPTLDPHGTDLDADPAAAGAAAWREAAAGLHPRIAIAFRRGPGALVISAPTAASLRAARRYARLAGLPLASPSARVAASLPTAGLAASPSVRVAASLPTAGLAAWTAAALPGTAAFTVELPGARLSARAAARLAYALDRLAGTRFAAGANADRLGLIRHGIDPRRSRY